MLLTEALEADDVFGQVVFLILQLLIFMCVAHLPDQELLGAIVDVEEPVKIRGEEEVR